jgi:hypothetical protein
MKISLLIATILTIAHIDRSEQQNILNEDCPKLKMMIQKTTDNKCSITNPQNLDLCLRPFLNQDTTFAQKFQIENRKCVEEIQLKLLEDLGHEILRKNLKKRSIQYRNM